MRFQPVQHDREAAMGVDFPNDYAEIRVLEDIGATVGGLHQATGVRHGVVGSAQESVFPVSVAYSEAVPAAASKFPLHCVPFVSWKGTP